MTRTYLIAMGIMCIAVGAAVYPKEESRAALALTTVAPLPPSAGTPATEPLEAAAPVVATTGAAPAPSAAAPAATTAVSAGPLAPQRLSIPSIGFDNAVVKVGTNAKGEMDVPSGKTRNVGWYKNGTMPGDTGSAVIGAHVFAAFSRLDEVKPGDALYVSMSDGTVRTFIVEETNTFKLSDMSADWLFNRSDKKRLNLITCAGSLTKDGSTYTHRLVVSAVAA